MIKCTDCGSTRIGVTEVGGDMFGWHSIPYCISCSDKEKNPNLERGETLDSHAHNWQARCGRYGGFLFCNKCKKSISAAKDETLFKQTCTYRAETIENAIAKARYYSKSPRPYLSFDPAPDYSDSFNEYQDSLSDDDYLETPYWGND